MNENEVISPNQAEPIKYYENISILNFLDFDMYQNTELDFITQFDGFDALDVALLNYQSYTEEEVEVIKNMIIERDTKLQKSRGRDPQQEFPDNELVENMDYTFQKMQIGELISNESI